LVSENISETLINMKLHELRSQDIFLVYKNL